MPDYMHDNCRQFAHAPVNFRRVPVVTTSNPFIAPDVPAASEGMVVIRFANPQGGRLPRHVVDDPWLVADARQRPVVRGGKRELAMQLSFTPFSRRMRERRKRVLGAL